MSRAVDGMGYPVAPVFALFTRKEIYAAKRLAAAHGYAWDVVRGDPRVYGWRYLRDAKIAIGNVDLGESCPVKD